MGPLTVRPPCLSAGGMLNICIAMAILVQEHETHLMTYFKCKNKTQLQHRQHVYLHILHENLQG